MQQEQFVDADGDVFVDTAEFTHQLVPHSAKTSKNMIECRCGFSCGTAVAWQRHVQRYEDQAQPPMCVKGAAELDLELNSAIRHQINDPNQAAHVQIDGWSQAFCWHVYRTLSAGSAPAIMPTASNAAPTTVPTANLFIKPGPAAPAATLPAAAASLPSTPAAWKFQGGCCLEWRSYTAKS